MDVSCLLVNLKEDDLADTWREKVASQEIPVNLEYVQGRELAVSFISSGVVAPLVIFADNMSPDLAEILRTYQTSFGPLSDFIVIVCGDPSPQFMADVFEYGIEQFMASETWPDEVAVLCRGVSEKLQDESSAEYKTVNLAMSIRTADTDRIAEAKAAIGDLATYDFRAAYTSGKAAEATGNYDEAIDSYRNASGMNKMFRPSSTSLGDACLITGKVDEAIAIFQKLDKSNPKDVDRKTSLASAFIEKGDFEAAEKYAKEAEALDPASTRLIEIKAQVCLSKGQVGEAFALMDKMSNVGPFFASKLNELGIKLSQGGKGKSALALYQKAHKIVREELRYKISMNAALAARRLQEFEMALKYVARSAKEFGSMSPKLAKIRDTILREKAAKEAAAGGAAGGNKVAG